MWVILGKCWSLRNEKYLGRPIIINITVCTSVELILHKKSFWPLPCPMVGEKAHQHLIYAVTVTSVSQFNGYH